MQKICRQCNLEYPIERFPPHRSICRRCKADHEIARYHSRREAQRRLQEWEPSEEAWETTAPDEATDEATDESRPDESQPQAPEPSEEEEYEDPAPLGALYMMENSRIPGEIKLGRSRRPYTRARELAGTHNFSMQVVAVFPGQGRLEPFVHGLLGCDRVPGTGREWFRVSRKRAFSAVAHAMDVYQ